MLATLPGSLVLYYGDELGMADVDVPVSQQLDEMSLARPGRPSRDRARTPMPWSGEKNAGFTSPSARPWLPVGEHATVNVESEQEDPGSVLNFWRELARLRRARPGGPAWTAGTRAARRPGLGLQSDGGHHRSPTFLTVK